MRYYHSAANTNNRHRVAKFGYTELYTIPVDDNYDIESSNFIVKTGVDYLW